jgi:hypothetical protein
LVASDPYYAMTDEDGHFEIGDIPAGTYRLSIWHPYVRDAYEQTITINPRMQLDVEFNVAAPTGRLYANQMVENAYIRYTITENVQSQIVPTLEKQSY